MAHAFTYDLIDPIEAGADVYTTLTFRKPTLDDIDAMHERMKSGSQLKAVRVLYARLTGIVEPVIGKMSVDDVQAIQAKLTPFLPQDDGKDEPKPS